jgi:hypothetical protein
MVIVLWLLTMGVWVVATGLWVLTWEIMNRPDVESIVHTPVPRMLVPPPPATTVRVRYQDEQGAIVGEENIDARLRRPSRTVNGSIFHADRKDAHGVWIYRRQGF